MRNGDNSAVRELGSDNLLNAFVVLRIYSCCSLVQYENLPATEKGPSEAHKLTLA